MRNVLFLLTVLLAFSTIAQIVRLRGATQAVAYDVRHLRGRVAELRNENAWHRSDMASRTTFSVLTERASSLDLKLASDELNIVELEDFQVNAWRGIEN